MNTVRFSKFLVNVIIFRWILTLSNGLINSISDIKKYEYSKLTKKIITINKNNNKTSFQSINHEVNVFHL
jgi:hypothetical protein